MNILVAILGVNDTSFAGTFREASRALEFLSTYDHEGSSVSLEIRCDDEAAYAVLEALTGRKLTDGLPRQDPR